MKHTRTRFMRMAAAAGAAALVLTACGNGDGAQGIEAVEPFFPVDADGNEVLPCGGYGFRLSDGDFWAAFNEQLNEFRQDGTTLEIITAYEDFAPADVEKANELTANSIAPNANQAAGDGEGLLEELQSAGSITIGVANEVPFGYVGDDGEATGIAPDVARAVLTELGITDIQVDVVEFGQLIGGLQAQQFDLIAAGMYINETGPSRSCSVTRTTASPRAWPLPRATRTASLTTPPSSTTRT
jgi:ABC-type amino acid transport substrate-binding protein